ncbi:LysR family transcriptional regulator [Mycoplasmatota bacterium]|nr:LysR family transcriptional regulator [Mycoplasmatota bacterium]
MNILHLRYACEIEKTKSISKAAENLFMSQPNLSRAIKDLESSLNIQIFERTSKGMNLTVKGEEFLYYAKKILSEVDEIENLYLNEEHSKLKFSISVPRASYISHAFAEFAKKLENCKQCEVFYKETNSLKAIRNILNSHYNLGIIRYQSTFENYFKALLKEKGLKYELISEFSYHIFMSKNHPLAQKEEIKMKDIEAFTEIAHADPYVPSLSSVDVKKEELPDNVKKRIYVYERASQFNLLEKLPNTYMWGSPVPKQLLDKYDLVQKKYDENAKVYKDILIYHKDYHLTSLDHEFLNEIVKSKRQILDE